MDLPPAKVEWYLARDGKQYGPVSDLEMLELIERGHLEPNDLLWREGFSEWRQAAVVYPELQNAGNPSHTNSAASSIIVGESLVNARPLERRARSRKALVLPLFLLVILGGAISYGYFSANWLLSETANFLAQFLAL